jgi:phosphatidylserine/phosphatidylglycerophosphate/cardiolipin synthase-like enzyme
MRSILLRAAVPAAALALLVVGARPSPVLGVAASGFGTPAFGPNRTLTATSVGGAYIAAVGAAKKTLDVTTFEITKVEVVNAIIAAAGRGVKVRLITDSSYAGNAPFVTQLKAGHVQVVERAGSNSTGIMHDKYTVIDGKSVWTGSANLTPGGTFVNAENGILIKSTTLATDYEADFADMWGGKWGNQKTGAPKHPSVSIADGKGGKTKVDVFFSGQQGGAEFAALAAVVSAAKTSVHVCAYEFTKVNATQPLIDAIVAAARRGVEVKAIFDDSSTIETQENANTLAAVKAAGAKTVEWHPPFGLMHDKLLIVDGKTVEVGSFNYSSLAATLSGSIGNDENFLIVHDNAAVASAFDAEFASLWTTAGGH